MARNKKKHENPEDYAGSAVAFVASLDHDATQHAHTDDVGTTWLVDNGADCHCSSVLSDFTNLKTSMGTVSGIDCEIKGLGDVIINVSNTEENRVAITLKDVLFVPALEGRSKGAYL